MESLDGPPDMNSSGGGLFGVDRVGKRALGVAVL
jgi:hypothetical protein